MTTAAFSQTNEPPSPAMANPPVPEPMIMMQMVLGYWVSQSIYAAAKLSLADHMQQGAHRYEDLAVATGSNPQALYRLLRALASVGIFAETEPGYFALTPLATYLKSGVPGSVKDVSIMMGDREHYSSWGNIMHSLKTGESAFGDLFGMNVFEYYSQNPEPAAVFDRAMTGFSQVETAGVITAYDFSEIRTLVDVAGGHGSLLLSVLDANAHLKGILFDMPAVIDRARAQVAGQPGGDRCQLASGDFFESVPAGADAYMMKHIIHDWDDERSIAILKRCREAMTDNGRVLVIEQVIPPGNDPFIGKLLDVNMLVMCPGGKERTPAEYEALFSAAGLRLNRIVPTASLVSVVEGVKA